MGTEAQQQPEQVDYQLDPHYHVTTEVGGAVVGEAEQPIGDPFATTVVELGVRDLLKGLWQWLRHHKPMIVRVSIGGDWDAIKHVATNRPIAVLPPQSVMGLVAEQPR